MSHRLLALSALAAGAAALSGCVVLPLEPAYGYGYGNGYGYGYGPASVRVAPPVVVVAPPRHRYRSGGYYGGYYGGN